MSDPGDGLAAPRPTLVVGGAGFLGSHLVERLLDEGSAVDVVDNLESGSLSHLADARRRGGTLKFHNFDIRSPDGLAVISMRRPTVLYHLALFGGGGHPGSPAAAAGAFASMVEVLDVAVHAGVDKVVAAIPATSVYGKPPARQLPVKELPLAPRGLRGVAAKAIVDVLTCYRELHGVEFTALAMTNVYGPRQDRGVVSSFVAAARRGESPTIEGDGRQTRDLLYVEDAVDALVKAGSRGGGLVINIGTGVQTSIRDLWTAVAPGGAAARLGHPRPDELSRFAVSPVRARIHLAWSPWTTLPEGLTETLASHHSEG